MIGNGVLISFTLHKPKQHETRHLRIRCGQVYKATPTKYLDLHDINAIKLEAGCALFFVSLFIEETRFYWQFGI